MNTPTRKTATAPHSGSKLQPAIPTGHEDRRDLLISVEDFRLCAYQKGEGAGSRPVTAFSSGRCTESGDRVIRSTSMTARSPDVNP